MIRRYLLAASLIALARCGVAEIVTPDPLRIVDTFPSNGALVPGPDVPIAIVFSADVDEATLAPAVMLEQLSDSGGAGQAVPLSLVDYRSAEATAQFETPALSPDTAFILTILADELRSTEGAGLTSDFIRRFKTAP